MNMVTLRKKQTLNGRNCRNAKNVKQFKYNILQDTAYYPTEKETTRTKVRRNVNSWVCRHPDKQHI